MGFVQRPTKVVPASREALERFSKKLLDEYARALGASWGWDTKGETIDFLLSKGATLLASLGD